MAIDRSDHTVRLEHYDKSSGWHPVDVVAPVPDPIMEQIQLRFAAGQPVRCNMGDGEWVDGVIDSVWSCTIVWLRWVATR